MDIKRHITAVLILLSCLLYAGGAQAVIYNSPTEIKANNLTVKQSPWADVKAWGANGADALNDQPSIQSAITAGKRFLFFGPGDYYLESPILVDGVTVNFWFAYGATLHVKNNTAGIKSQNSGAVVRIIGDGQINGVVGYTGYGIHVTYGKIVITSLNFYQTNNWSIYVDRTTNPVSYSQIGRLFLPDSYGIKIEGVTPGASVDSQWGQLKFSGATRSELLYIKDANDVNVGSIVGAVDLASKPAIRLENAKSISIVDPFVTSIQYYGYYIDSASRDIVFGNAQDYNSKTAWFIDGDEIQIANLMALSSRETSVEFGSNGSGIQIGRLLARDGSSVTGSPCIKVNSANSRISIGAVWTNSANDLYAFDLPASNRVILNNLSLVSGTTNKFKSNIGPYRMSGGGDSGSILTENSGTYTANGGTTTYTIPHGLVGLNIVPAVVRVVAASADATGAFYVSGVDGTNITITYISATPGGTNNVSFRWSVRYTP